jgi:hypothetical protein
MATNTTPSQVEIKGLISIAIHSNKLALVVVSWIEIAMT